MNSDGILGTNVYVTLICTDSICGNRHSLDQCVGVTLKDRTVHERTGVTLVRVTSNVLLNLATVVGSELPLQTRGESAASASAKTGIQNGLDNLVGCHLGQSLMQREVTVHSDILLDILGVDNTTVTKGYTVLLLIEHGLAQGSGLSLCLALCVAGLVVYEALDDTALHQVLVNDLRNIINRYSAVEGTLGIHDHNGTESAKTEASGHNDLDLIFKALSLEFLRELVAKSGTTGRSTSCTTANQYMRTNHFALFLLITS